MLNLRNLDRAERNVELGYTPDAVGGEPPDMMSSNRAFAAMLRQRAPRTFRWLFEELPASAAEDVLTCDMPGELVLVNRGVWATICAGGAAGWRQRGRADMRRAGCGGSPAGAAAASAHTLRLNLCQ